MPLHPSHRGESLALGDDKLSSLAAMMEDILPSDTAAKANVIGDHERDNNTKNNMISPITLFGNIDRARQISTILMKHGFGELLSRIGLGSLRTKKDEEEKPKTSFAQRLRLTLQDLGPSFIKLGQIISTRPDLIPADVITELKKLQDEVPPIPFNDVKEVIESSLGSTLEELFIEFQEKPLASASIGQVHRARIMSGETPVDVVVKVQRPNIKGTIERDLDLLHSFASLIERFIPESRIYSPVGLVKEFDRTITAELNFDTEAGNAERFARNFANDPYAKFPKIYRERSSKRVLTMEFFNGVKITSAVKEGASGEKIAKRSLRIVAQMIFEDGFFHADPHPGNVMVLRPLDSEEPTIGLLDLGLVGSISEKMQEGAIDLMAAAIREDVDALTDALLTMGKPRGSVDKEALRALVGTLSQKYLGKPLKEIEISAVISDLVGGAMQFNIDMPTELVMMGKAIMTVEGIGKELYPELDIYTELKPYFLKLLKRRYSPEKILREVLRGAGQLNKLAINLPEQLHTILEDTRKGRFSIKTQDPGMVAAADRLGRRLFSGIIVASLILGSSILIEHQREAISWLAILMLISGISLFFAHVMRDFWRGSDT
jgi:ubiquinone biosynthesis protein